MAEKIQKALAPAPPPAFSDIGKAANDLINKDFYHANQAILEVKVKGANGIAFTTKGSATHNGATNGSVEAKKTIQNGVTITESFNTAGLLSSKAELDNTVADNLKIEALHLLNPNKGGNQGQKLNAYFKQQNFHLRSFLDYSASGNISTIVDGVAGYEGFLVGGEVGYDVQKAAISRYSASVGYNQAGFSAAIQATQNLSVFAGSFYQKVNPTVEAGVKAVYDTKASSTIGIEIASKYKLDPLSFAKAKINDRGIAAVSYNTKVNTGLTLGLGLSVDTQKINESAHKVGASFTFEG